DSGERAVLSRARPTAASATGGSARTRTGIRSSSTAGTSRMPRPQLLERYRALPLPSTTDEPWRFTDLKGFDPDSFVSNGHVGSQTPAQAAGSMLDLEVAALA